MPRLKKRKVAVITRTRNRPLMLKRALESVSGQSTRDFIWVIVNDGGDHTAVDQIAELAKNLGIETLTLQHSTSLGMEAASNAGVHKSDSQYIVIHDDDDTWEADFLKETTAYLDRQADVAGVVTHAMRISEIVRQDQLIRLKQLPHLPVLQAVQLADMARSNLFPPIAFLYRRSLFEQLRGYDETMSVLGDWDFNLRALLAGDIGVIPKCLANYHARPSHVHAGSAYANSISPQSTDHLTADAAYRNKWIRNDIKIGKSGLGTLLAIGRLQKQQSRSARALAKAATWWELFTGRASKNS